MRTSRLTLYLMLALAWLAFAVWQYRSYRLEQELIRETLRQQAHSVNSALVGGIRSHRRLGRFFELQLQGMLDEVVRASDILAAGVIVGDNRLSLAAGQTQGLPAADGMESGESWQPDGFLLVERYFVLPSPGGIGEGLGLGGPGGRGRGLLAESAEADWSEGAEITAALLLDRQRADSLLRSSARNHAVATVAGALVLIGLALAWRTTVGWIEERSYSQLLERDARHYCELSQAAAGLAHETRNPLGLVRGWTERLARGDIEPAEQPRRAQAVLEECDRITARINQFLAFARPCQPQLGAVDLHALVEELQSILQPDSEARSTQLVWRGPPSPTVVAADREMLRQALFNLLQNAIEFSPQDSQIQIELRADREGQWTLLVSDRGPGVQAEHQTSLFTPYFTTRPTGTGLGLAIVRRIAFAHGWRATWQARPGGGSSFALEGIHGWGE